jgi:hypothetical protein
MKIELNSNSNRTFKSVELTNDYTVTAQIIAYYIIKTFGRVGVLITALLTSTTDRGER